MGLVAEAAPSLSLTVIIRPTELMFGKKTIDGGVADAVATSTTEVLAVMKDISHYDSTMTVNSSEPGL
jgi:hypothetical protein